MTDSNQKKYINTLNFAISRKKNLIDEKVQYFKDVPLFSWIEISPIDACNRKCVFCPKVDTELAPDTFNKMENKLIEKLASELKSLNYAGTVIIAGYGEPMLDKNIYEKIKIISNVCNTEIVTNGDALTNKTVTKLFESNLNHLVVSMYDGPHQVDIFKKLLSECKIDESKYTLKDRWYSEADGFGLMLTNRAGTLNFENKNLPENLSKTCFYPHYSVMIDWDGSVFLCPQDWNRKIKSGNISNQNIVDIWNSKILKKYRNNLANGKRSENPCIKCNANGTLHGSKHSKAWTKYYRNK